VDAGLLVLNPQRFCFGPVSGRKPQGKPVNPGLPGKRPLKTRWWWWWWWWQ